MYGEWHVQELCVTALSEHAGGIITYGVTVDGCPSAVVQPHILAAAREMDMRIAGMRTGTASPFFTVVDRPSQPGREAMKRFEALLGKQDIKGPYCDEAGCAMSLERDSLVRAVIVGQSDRDYEVEVIATTHRLLPANVIDRTIPGRCTAISINQNRTVLRLAMIAPDTETLARRLRLVANMAWLRWDKQDAATAELLGEPLV